MVDLLVLGKLLLVLLNLGLQSRLLQVLGLLIGVDSTGSNEFVESLASVLRDDVIDLGCVGLWHKALADKLDAGRAGCTNKLLIGVANVPLEHGQHENTYGNIN